MTAVTLTRTDHARRMARFYVLDVQPDLFGAWCFIREWGRIGRPGQLRHVPYPTEDEAKEALARQRRAKERRGYRTPSLGVFAYPRKKVQSRITPPKRSRFRSGFQPIPERFRPRPQALAVYGIRSVRID